MPAYLPALGIAGVKIVNVHPHNRTRGLPTVMALTVIIDVETGVPQAIVNATELTAMRTGASGAIAARHLSPRQSVTLGVIGAGRQAEALVEATAAALTIEGILAWSRTEKSAEAFAARYADYNTRAVPIERACDCDVLFTTTPSEKPLVMADWVCEGTHISAIGADAPGKQELGPALLLKAEVFVDDPVQAIHSGEVNVPISTGLYDPAQMTGTLGEVIIGKKGRLSPDAVTIFDSTGLAIQDLAIAALVVREEEEDELPFTQATGRRAGARAPKVRFHKRPAEGRELEHRRCGSTSDRPKGGSSSTEGASAAFRPSACQPYQKKAVRGEQASPSSPGITSGYSSFWGCAKAFQTFSR